MNERPLENKGKGSRMAQLESFERRRVKEKKIGGNGKKIAKMEIQEIWTSKEENRRLGRKEKETKEDGRRKLRWRKKKVEMEQKRR